MQISNDKALGAGTGAEGDGTEVGPGGVLQVGPNVTITGERLRMTGGSLVPSDSAVVDSPIVLEAPSIIGGDLRGVISGGAPVTLQTGVLRGANTFTGPATVRTSGVEVRNPAGLGDAAAGTVVLSQGELKVYAASAEPIEVQTGGKLFLAGGGVAHAERVTLTGGTITSDPGATFNGTLEVQSGSLQLDLSGGGTVTKSSGLDATILSLGASFDGQVVVRQGRLTFRGNALGSTAGNTVVSARTGASLLFTGIASAEPIDLNNATGTGLGALVVKSDFPAVLSGPVSLGGVGSSIGVDTGKLTLSGPLRGGSLTVNSINSSGSVTLTSPDVTYTGQTRVTLLRRLLLDGAGRLTRTSDVYLVGGTLRFSNNAASLPDRLADDIPIALAGGILSIDQGTETVGPVTLERGMGSVNISTTGDGGPGSLTLGALTRRPGTRVRFTTGDFGLGPDQSLAVGQLGGHVYFATPPTLNDGLIGGWAVVSRSYPRFAGYGPAGVESVAGTGQDVNVAAPETNLELGASAVLASSRTVNSLRVAHPAALDLGGHTLTVDSGGVIIHGSDAAGPPNLYNGTLVPGPSAGGEMYFYGGRITATVADGPGGPTTPVFDGVTYLGGASTYTGATYVNGDAVLHLTGPDALPAGTDAVLDEGTVIFDYNSATPLKLGALRMRGHGGGGIVGGQRPVDAAAYDLELGRITSGLAGSGPMTKRMDGTVQITGGDRSAFTGTVDVLAGVLQVDSLGDGPATGRVRVDPGAEVRVAGWLDNPIELRGGGITGLASFAVPLRGGGAGDATLRAVAVSGPLTVDPGVTLTVDRRSASNLATSMTGDVRVDGNLVAAAGATLNVTPAGGRTLSGSGTVGGAVIVGNGAAAAPGGPAGPGSSATGVLAVAGAYSQTAGGRLRVQIASPDLVGAGKPYARQADALSVTGAAALDGTLELALLDGYVPSAGEAFRVVSAGSRAGRFARYLGLLLGPGADPDHVRYAAPAYDATGLTLTVADLLLGDATSDRRVDFADLVVLAQHYNRGVPAGDDPWADGDFNVDGAVDFADLVALAQHYNTGPGTAGPAAAAPPDGLFGLAWAQAQAPEPSVAVGALVLMLRSLRRRRPS